MVPQPGEGARVYHENGVYHEESDLSVFLGKTNQLFSLPIRINCCWKAVSSMKRKEKWILSAW